MPLQGHQEQENNGATTAMWEAAAAGDLVVCRYLLEHASASAICPPTWVVGLLPLFLLLGHETTFLAMIVDFLGVVRGRQLRNFRLRFRDLRFRGYRAKCLYVHPHSCRQQPK